jgi:hypothetical protein
MLFAIGQFLDPFGQIGIEQGRRNAAVVCNVRLALAYSLDQRFGEGAMVPPD